MRALKRLVPPAIADGLEAVLGRSIRFSGPYASWQEAIGKSDGYDSAKVLAKVAEATRRVVSGAAPYERDGVVFDRIHYSFPVLATLLKGALQGKGSLGVLDFGGGLGTSYRECWPFLSGVVERCSWTVVEQPAFAEYGHKHFETGQLKFCSSMADALRSGAPDVVLASSVLQYLPEPWRVLGELLEAGARHVVVDRTVVHRGPPDRLYVQHVPPALYRVDYPCWSLSESTLLEKLGHRYDLVCDFASLPFPALRRIDSEFKGYIFQRRPAAEWH